MDVVTCDWDVVDLYEGDMSDEAECNCDMAIWRCNTCNEVVHKLSCEEAPDDCK